MTEWLYYIIEEAHASSTCDVDVQCLFTLGKQCYLILFKIIKNITK